MESKAGVFPWLKWLEMCFFLGTLLGTNISPEMAILKIIFLLQRWDMYVYVSFMEFWHVQPNHKFWDPIIPIRWAPTSYKLSYNSYK